MLSRTDKVLIAMQGQIAARQTMAIAWLGKLLSGEYKTADIRCAGEQLSDEEKRRDTVNTIFAHARICNEIVESMLELAND